MNFVFLTTFGQENPEQYFQQAVDEICEMLNGQKPISSYVCLGLRKKEHKPKVLFILANEINVKQLKRLTYASTKLRIKF